MRTWEQSAPYLEKFAMRWHPWATFSAILLLLGSFFREEAIFSLAATEDSETRKLGDRDNFWCPQKCACSTLARIVDCSSLGAVTVPDVHNQTTRLWVSAAENNWGLHFWGSWAGLAVHGGMCDVIRSEVCACVLCFTLLFTIILIPGTSITTALVHLLLISSGRCTF